MPLGELADAAHVAHNADCVPLLLDRYAGAGAERYAAIAAELRAGPSSPRQWALDLRAAHAAVRQQIAAAKPSAAHCAVLAGVALPPAPEVGARLGTAPPARRARVAADAMALREEAPALPSVSAICTRGAPDERALGKGMQGAVHHWLARAAHARLWEQDKSEHGRLTRARLGACGGQGVGASPFFTAPDEAAARPGGAELYRATARRFLGIPPPLCADLRACGACGQRFVNCEGLGGG